MANADIKLLKKLRVETGASISDCRMALEETENDIKKAEAWLRKRGMEKADKKSDRATSEGLVEAYIHAGGKVGVLVEIRCETDFVARTGDFIKLAREIGMQVAAMNPDTVEEMMKQEYIRDSSMTMGQLVKSVIGKLGENIIVKRFQRFAI